MENTSSPQGHDAKGGFRLLVPGAESPASKVQSIEVGGIRWVPKEYASIAAVEAPGYACISYSWGRGRIANPFHDDQLMSERAVLALDSAIAVLRLPAIWLDALCVPPEGPAQTACLRSMGAIYSRAVQVIAVLSKPCSVVLEQVDRTGRIDATALLILEGDDWVTRCWTYQEIVNSKDTQFVAEGGSVAVPGQSLLRAVMEAISDYKEAHGLNSFRFRTMHPTLDSLEGLIADYLTSDYLERSAYQVMSAMAGRHAEQADERFDAMIGAITATPMDGDNGLPLPASEHFMKVCEARGDYSFIYCVAPRSEVPGRHWRPVAGSLTAVLPWHTQGGAQAGSLHPTHLQLSQMCCLTPGKVSADARGLIDWWLQGDGAGASSNDVADLLLERLRQAGFSGCGEYVELEVGYFFPQAPPTHDNDEVFMAATGVQWTHGSPGLVLRRNETDIYQFDGVGVFVGRVPKVGETINVG